MDEAELALKRIQMGLGIEAWGRGGPGWATGVGPDHWYLLTGLPSADANMALVHGAEAARRDDMLSRIEAAACPAIMILAGPGEALAAGMPEGWADVGRMPFMAADLSALETGPDTRVRQGGPRDVDTFTHLSSEAFGIDPAVAAAMAAPLGQPGTAVSFWLLEDEGRARSGVVSCRVADSVSLWTMSTPARFGRRGYGRALLGAVLHAARLDGATVGLLGATPAGFPLYQATGWRTLEEWRLFVNATSVQFAG